VLAEERYLQAARATYGFMNQELWDEGVGVYRSAVNAQVSEYTPMTIGAAIGAMRVMILANEDPAEIERFKRFWVQAVNSSGLQQAEYEETGEKDFFQADGDPTEFPGWNTVTGSTGLPPSSLHSFVFRHLGGSWQRGRRTSSDIDAAHGALDGRGRCPYRDDQRRPARNRERTARTHLGIEEEPPDSRLLDAPTSG